MARVIRECLLTYSRGNYEHVKQVFQNSGEDDALKFCISVIAIAAAISTGDYPMYLKIEAFLKDIIAADIDPVITACAELALANGYLGAGAPNMVPGWLKDGDFSTLPPQARMNATLMRAWYFKWQGKYDAMLAVAQTALVFCSYQAVFTHEDIYLQLMCAHAHYALDQEEDAKTILRTAMSKNLPLNIITPFVESLYFMGGFIERILEQEYPQYYDTIIEQWNRIYANWLAFHNRFTKDNITTILTLREYHIAMLASQRVPRAKIARQFNISLGRLNNVMAVIYGKLHISSQAELSDYVQ
jgi:DNA-binding CsgD family transcriptional regulator